MNRQPNSKIFILLFSLFLASCGQDHSGKDRSLASVGEEFDTEINQLSSQDQSIAYRICRALQQKRINWHTSVIGKKASFQVTSNNCSDDDVSFEIETTISSTLMSNPIIFDSLSTEKYSKEVMTEIHGPLKSTCPLITNGDIPIEFYVEDQDRVYMEFSKLDGSSDRLTLKYAEINSNDQQEISGYKVYKSTQYDIVTTSPNGSSEHPMLGTVSNIYEIEACQEGTKISTFNQKLLTNL